MMLEIDEKRPNPRHVAKATEVLSAGGLIIYPTDTVYSFGCDISSKSAIERLYAVKKMDRKKPLSFIFSDISMMSSWVKNFDDRAFKIMKKILPGPYTVILNASKSVPNAVLTKQKTIGVRIPDCPFTLDVVKALGRPILSASVENDEDEYLIDPITLPRNIVNQTDLVLYSGPKRADLSTMLDFSLEPFRIVREGKGSTDFLGE